MKICHCHKVRVIIHRGVGCCLQLSYLGKDCDMEMNLTRGKYHRWITPQQIDNLSITIFIPE